MIFFLILEICFVVLLLVKIIYFYKIKYYFRENNNNFIRKLNKFIYLSGGAREDYLRYHGSFRCNKTFFFDNPSIR